jgi:DNA invertase Pin-like site-specific DNA recombinase
MLTVLGGLDEFERELIRARTGEGRKRAKAHGVRFGRPRKIPKGAGQPVTRVGPIFDPDLMMGAGSRQNSH